MKKIIVTSWLTLLFSGVGLFFWYNEWIYSLPTPVPVNYKRVSLGQTINVPTQFGIAPDKPIFLHFFNPDCPCSRFNIPHFKSLVKKYGNEVTFAVVPIILPGSQFTAEEIQKKFDLDIPVLFATNLALESGVYATPQAVILDGNRHLVYRGNYNKSRYCTDKKSNYAQMALESLLQKHLIPKFDSLALTAYGCQLPLCTR